MVDVVYIGMRSLVIARILCMVVVKNELFPAELLVLLCYYKSKI